ncbi:MULTISPECIES: zinc ribbon domain-containing protein [unclassified Bradyrhizobium]
MLLCGVCGRRLGVRYTGNGGIYPLYQCVWKHREALATRACLSVPSAPLDQAIADRLVSAVTPVTIELALAALTDLEKRDQEIGAQWRMRIERARYEADLAERRYEAVDPANRLIAATLETRWNDAMQRLDDLEAELAAFERETMRAVTAEQKREILQLAEDFPRLWSAATTSPRDRKRILRLLVRDITVVKVPASKIVNLHVRWQGGATETLELQLPPNRADAVRYPAAFVDRIRQLAVGHHDHEILPLLRDEGHQSSTGKPLTVGTIKWLRYKHHIPAPRPPKERSPSAKCAKDMASASTSSIIGLNAASSALPSTSRMHRTRSGSTTHWINAFGDGLPTHPIFVHHPQLTPHEVHYARHVGIPSGRVLPLSFGI